MATAIKEYDELKRKLEGSARRGERTDLTSPQHSEVWTQDQTAKDLGISRQAVGKALATIWRMILVGQRTDTFSSCEKVGWRIEDTAKDLGISVGATHKAIKIATAIEEYPELAKREQRNQEILDLYLASYDSIEISEKIGLTDRQVRNIIEDGKNSILSEISAPESLQRLELPKVR